MSTTLYMTTQKDYINNFSDIYNSTTSLSLAVTDGLNITDPGQKVQLSLYRLLIPSIGAIIIVLNLAVVFSSGLIIKKGTQPIATYLFLGNVAASDLTTAIAILIGNLTPKEDRSHFVCAFSLGLIVSSTLVSIYSVGLIAVDRYLYIVHGLKYQTWVYPVRARLCICFTWILGCLLGFLPIMGWSGDTYNGRQCWFITLVPPHLILLICLIGLLPILVVIILYSIILYHAIRKVIQLRNAGKQQSNNPNQLRIFRGKENIDENQTEDIGCFRRCFRSKKTKSPSKAKAIKVVLFTTGSFIITWVPYFVASILYINCDKKLMPERCKSLEILIASPLAILGFLNSLLNPIIYAWWHKGFRNFVKKIICQKKNNTVSPSTTSTSVEKSTRKNANLEVGMVNIDLNQ